MTVAPPEQVKFALITGAAGGIGRELVSTFRDAGYKVVATDILKKPKDLIADHYLHLDLVRYAGDESYAEQANSKIKDITSGNLGALINNAAHQVVKPLEHLTRKDWIETLNTNLLAPFFLTQALLADLESNKGSIVNISSIHARQTKKGFVAYSTSKGGLSTMTRSICVDLGGRVRINAIEPAAIETEMLKSVLEQHPNTATLLPLEHPIGRIGKPLEIARLALWLSSNSCEFIHGECLAADGGASSMLGLSQL